MLWVGKTPDTTKAATGLVPVAALICAFREAGRKDLTEGKEAYMTKASLHFEDMSYTTTESLRLSKGFAL